MTINYFTIDELMAFCMSKTIKDNQIIFNGVAVALPFTAMVLAKKTHAPDCIFLGGLTAGVDPMPPFLVPTSADNVMLENSTIKLHKHDIFDFTRRGMLDRIFFGGAQIDQYGNLNNTLIGNIDNIKVKLPGGAGASTISCFAKNFTIWCPRHGLANTKNGKKYALVKKVDFVTTFGQKTHTGLNRQELDVIGGGPDYLITDLGVFDFDPNENKLRLISYHPGISIEEIQDNTEFDLLIHENCIETPMPTKEEIEIIRVLDPLEVRKREFTSEQLEKKFYFKNL